MGSTVLAHNANTGKALTEALTPTLSQLEREPGEVWRAQQQALLRLLMFITGEVHSLLQQAGQDLRKLLMDENEHDAPQEWDGMSQARVNSGIEKIWAETYTSYAGLLDTLRTEGANLAFGGLGVLHDNLVRPAVQALQKSQGLQESEGDSIAYYFKPQVQQVLDAAASRQYDDGITFSRRLWNLNRQSLAGLKQTVYDGIASGNSAWNIAKKLEDRLGFGAGCPRWTATRLRLTKKEIAGGDMRGLKSGDECAGQGVAYNALRLARNEIQIAHAIATDTVMDALPFVEEEQINLSPSHPVEDGCDTVIASGRDGAGIYPKGTISLPIHVQCLCFKTAVLMSPDAFTGRLRGWLQGSNPWPAMSQYNQAIGGNLNASFAGDYSLMTLLRWAFGNLDDMQAVL